MKKPIQETYDPFGALKTTKTILCTDATYYGAYLSIDKNFLILDGYDEGCYIEISDELKDLLIKELYNEDGE